MTELFEALYRLKGFEIRFFLCLMGGLSSAEAQAAFLLSIKRRAISWLKLLQACVICSLLS